MESDYILQRVDNVEHSMAKLADVFSDYNSTIALQRDAGDKLASVLLRLARNETNASLRNGLIKFSDIMLAIHDYADTKVQRLQNKVILNLSTYDQTCKETKAKFKKCFASTSHETKRGQLGKFLRSKSTSKEKEGVEKIVAGETSWNLARQMESFEKKRLEDVKLALKEFVDIELRYHAKALELCTEACQKVDEIEPSDMDLSELMTPELMFRNIEILNSPQAAKAIEEK